MRAHHGVLVLDELLEFSAAIQSALREPFENGSLQLGRSYYKKTFPCDFVAIATTNLCACGEYTPRNLRRCRCSSQDLKKYQKKLTGPFVDRFSILNFTEDWAAFKGESVSSAEILEKIKKATVIRVEKRKQKFANHKMPIFELENELENVNLLTLLPDFKSQRRKKFTLSVARTIADLEESTKICQEHLLKSMRYTFHAFESLKTRF